MVESISWFCADSSHYLFEMAFSREIKGEMGSSRACPGLSFCEFFSNLTIRTESCWSMQEASERASGLRWFIDTCDSLSLGCISNICAGPRSSYLTAEIWTCTYIWIAITDFLRSTRAKFKVYGWEEIVSQASPQENHYNETWKWNKRRLRNFSFSLLSAAIHPPTRNAKRWWWRRKRSPKRGNAYLRTFFACRKTWS